MGSINQGLNSSFHVLVHSNLYSHPPSSQNPMDSAPPPRRTPRRSAPSLNNDESLSDELLPRPPKRNRTLKEREHETHTEALIALSLGFPIDALLPAELAAAASPLSATDVNNFIVVRNHILARWRTNVRSHLSIPQIRESVSADYDHLISAAFSFLSEHGYINFGVSNTFSSFNVVIIGAGLAAARQLLGFGFKVIVLEGRCRPGGRVFTFNSSNAAVDADIDLGANLLGVLARQLGIPLHKICDRCPLFRPGGEEVDRKLDSKIDSVFNRLLDKATELREMLGESVDDISLGSAIERLRELFAVARGGDERELLDWHLANLEYANARCLSDLSLAHWDKDDQFEMDGGHCFLAGDNWRLINALCEGVPVLYGKTVTRIAYGDVGVEVVVAGGQVFQADMVLCTVPLGILKYGSTKFDPELHDRKLGAIQSSGWSKGNDPVVEESPPPPPPNASLETGSPATGGSGGADDWRKFRDAGLLDPSELQRRDRGALAARVSELEKELYEYQYSMGLLLIEKKEWSAKYEEMKQAISTAEEILKREKAAHLTVVSEFGKREENLERALGVEKNCAADLEKSLREMRAEIAEVKFTSDKKLTDAHALEATIEEKYLEIEGKLRSADAKLAEASRKSTGMDRKLEDVEARERKLQRELLSFDTEQKACEKDLAEQRKYLRDWENKLQEGQKRLVDSQRLLNEREDRAMEMERSFKNKKEELEEARRVIEVMKTTLKDRDDEISTRLRALASKEKDAKMEMENLAKKEKDLLALKEALNSKEKVGIQKLTEDHNAILDARKHDFEKEMHEKRKSGEEEVKKKLDAVEKEKIEIGLKEEQIVKREQAIESKMENIKIKERDLDSKSKALKKWEESIREGEKKLKEESKQIGQDTQELVVSKNGLERLKTEIEAEKQQIIREKENLKLTKQEREQLLLLQAKLKQEIDEYNKFKGSLVSETEALRLEREKFEREWEVLDERRMALEVEQKHVNDQKCKFEKWRHNEEERLRNEELEKKVYIHQELEGLRLKKEAFESTIEHEQSEARDALKKEHADIARELEIRKHELEMNIQKKHEDMEKVLRDREAEFDRQREIELNHIKSSSNLNESNARKLKMEQDRLEREKERLSLYGKKLEADQLEIQKDIETLRLLSRNLKDQRQEFIKEKEHFLAEAAQFKVCKSCGVQRSELELDGLLSSTGIEDAGNVLLPTLTDDFLEERLKGKNTEVSPRITGSQHVNSAVRMSWLQKCSRLFSLSPGNRADHSADGQPDKSLSFGTRLDGAASEGEAGHVPAPSIEFTKESFDIQRMQFVAGAKENEELERLDNTGDEPETSVGITENSVDIPRVHVDNGIRKREDDNIIPSIENHIEMEGTSLTQNGPQTQPLEQRRHQPSKRGRPKMIKRTRSVRAVVEDSKTFLGVTSEVEKDGGPIGDTVDSEKSHEESQGDSVHANQLATSGRPKRHLASIDTETTSDLVAEDSEACSESVSLGGRRKRRNVSAPRVQTLGEKRYNLRRSTIKGAAVAAQGISHQTKGVRVGNHRKLHENELSKGVTDGEGTSKQVVTTSALLKINVESGIKDNEVSLQKITQVETEDVGAESGDNNKGKSMEASEREDEVNGDKNNVRPMESSERNGEDRDDSNKAQPMESSERSGEEVNGTAAGVTNPFGGDHDSDSGGEEEEDDDGGSYEEEEECEEQQASIGKKILRFFTS